MRAKFPSLCLAGFISFLNLGPVAADDEASATAATVTSTKEIQLPTARPSNAVNVPSNFVSLGFETAFSWQYNDDLSHNLVHSLAQRMSAPPVIRIGGTSGDNLFFNPNQTEATVCISKDGCPDGSSATFILGPSYFDNLAGFKDAQFSIQAPLNVSVNRTNVLAYIQHAYNKIGADRVNAIALGNEVQFYEPNGGAYVEDANAAQKVIVDALNLGDAKIFETLDTPNYKANGPTKFNTQDAFEAGLKNDKSVKYVAEHYYQIGNNESHNLQAGLMNHTAITSKLSHYLPAIKYTRQNTQVQYVLSETAGVLALESDLDAFFGATLWGVDFQLYAMSLGVARVSGTQRPAAQRSLWIPEFGKWKPTVQGPWYTQPFVADFIGKDGDGNKGVVNIDLGTPLLSAYAMFNGQNLAKIVVVNLKRWGDANENARSAVKVQLKGLGGATKVEVKRLHADAGVQAGGWDVNEKNITWAGQQWSYKVDKGMGHGSVRSGVVNVTGGVAEVVIPDSEAIMLVPQA